MLNDTDTETFSSTKYFQYQFRDFFFWYQFFSHTDSDTLCPPVYFWQYNICFNPLDLLNRLFILIAVCLWICSICIFKVVNEVYKNFDIEHNSVWRDPKSERDRFSDFFGTMSFQDWFQDVFWKQTFLRLIPTLSQYHIYKTESMTVLLLFCFFQSGLNAWKMEKSRERKVKTNTLHCEIKLCQSDMKYHFFYSGSLYP